ncbi:MAG: 9-O-acetylesterase [Lewinellaceae bacterium]|nr:9-O-acetylesterase [Lewinellaceae bacterium]
MSFNNFLKAFLAAACWALSSPIPAAAQLSLPRFFTDHMVLQRHQPIKVWGRAEAGAKVKVRLSVLESTTTANTEGKWLVTLPIMGAGGPHVLSASSGDQTITLNDVLIGDVWFCSGQSNMYWPVHLSDNAAAEIAAADHPQIRLLTVPNLMDTRLREDTGFTRWAPCQPSTIPLFSAVAYYFGRQLHQELGVPIGLIDATWGGTRIESWMSPFSLLDDPELGPAIQSTFGMDLQSAMDSIRQAILLWEAQIDPLDAGLAGNWQAPGDYWNDWASMNLPIPWEYAGLPGVDGVVWYKKTVELPAGQLAGPATLSLGPIDDSDITYINGVEVGSTFKNINQPRLYPISSGILQPGPNTITIRVKDHGYRGGFWGSAAALSLYTGQETIPLAGEWKYQAGTPALAGRPVQIDPNALPSVLYNAMVHPFTAMPIRGVAWYQGESNTGQPYYYRDRFLQFINDWRSRWGDSSLPFVFVQLANFRQPPLSPQESGWATIRESQALGLSLPNTGMAVAIDLGDPDNIHPGNKQDVGYRLSLCARAMAYGENLVYSGPVYRSLTIEDGTILIEFNHCGGGLASIHGRDKLRGFAIAGEDGRFSWAEAEIRSPCQVAVYSSQVSDPRYVRYAWSDNPGELDLYNADGLPAAPFRTDTLRVPWQR